jgi:hypothetical protein
MRVRLAEKQNRLSNQPDHWEGPVSTSIIDGTIEEIDLKRARGGIAIYKSIRFKQADGSSRTVTKQVVSQELADALTEGASGRFYLFSTFDIKGIHGFRSRTGESYYKFAGGANTKLFILLGAVNLAWVIFRVMIDGNVPMLGVALFILAVVGYIFMSKGAREAKAQFDEDGGYTAAIEQPAVQPG